MEQDIFNRIMGDTKVSMSPERLSFNYYSTSQISEDQTLSKCDSNTIHVEFLEGYKIHDNVSGISVIATGGKSDDVLREGIVRLASLIDNQLFRLYSRSKEDEKTVKSSVYHKESLVKKIFKK